MIFHPWKCSSKFFFYEEKNNLKNQDIYYILLMPKSKELFNFFKNKSDCAECSRLIILILLLNCSFVPICLLRGI